MSPSKFVRYAWGLLAYNLAVIVWGAFVRHTGSGAGCGDHWPLCNGEVLPRPERIQTIIEFTHRTTSFISLLAAIGLVFFAFRAFPRGHAARKASGWSVVFVMVSALIGAGLVLFGLVEQDDSAARAITLSVHLVNTFLLLASITLAAHYGGGGQRIQWRSQGVVAGGLGLGLIGFAVLGVSGAITSLGDTLFPAASSAQVIQDSMTPTAHFLHRLRLLHPLLATSVGIYLVVMAGLVGYYRPAESVRRWARVTLWIFGVQMALGLLSVLFKAPTWMALIHLLVGDLLWVALILTAVSALGVGVPRRSTEDSIDLAPIDPAASIGFVGVRPGWRDLVRAYVSLTKPRVVSLLLFTTLAAMFIAAGGWPGGWLLLAVAMGGYMAAGSANAINMVIDQDIDGRMRRTSSRPTVTHELSSRAVLTFAFVLAVGSFALLWASANLLSALMAMAGLAFYVVIYSLLLKRRTWHNIVIGGAAGSFPPLVGYAAVSGQLSPLAWWLFAIIFLWTPVHFWALALLIQDDYREVGVPMLPVVRGERVTVIQIMLYTVVTVVASVVPFVQRELGWVYLGPAVLLNAGLLIRSLNLFRAPLDRPRALSLFKYSMVYLALMFVVVAFDRGLAPAREKPDENMQNLTTTAMGTFR